MSPSETLTGPSRGSTEASEELPDPVPGLQEWLWVAARKFVSAGQFASALRWGAISVLHTEDGRRIALCAFQMFDPETAYDQPPPEEDDEWS